MAKKKAAKKKATRLKIVAKKKQSRKTVAKALAGKLRQPTLDGMPRVRNARLDKLAEAVGSCRDAINQNTVDEGSYRSAALKEMQAKNINFWSHAGVDFIRVPGEDKLKVKTHKDGGSAESGAGEDVETEQTADDTNQGNDWPEGEEAGDALD